MNSNHSPFYVGLGFILLSLLVSCSTAPKAPSSAEPLVSLRIVPAGDLARHGVQAEDDPLIFPMQLFSGAFGDRKEFVVFSLDLSLPEASRVWIDADIKDEKGEVIGSLFSRQEMREFWISNIPSEAERKMRLVNLDKFYMPSFDFTARKGHREYYFTCVGKAPLSRPAEAEVFVTVGGGEEQSFNLPLPLVNTKQKK